MGQIEDLRLFVTVVDEGSIARAARALGIAKSAVSRRLSQLESRYDVRLIDRQPGSWRITQAGRELYQRALSLVSDARDLEADFTHASQSVSGPLRVTIAREFGMSFLGPALHQFAIDHPAIELTLDFDDRTADLENENYDLAIRITSRVPDSMASVQLGSTRHGLFASPRYLAEKGNPAAPRDLERHALLHYGADRRPTWQFRFQDKPCSIKFVPRLNSNSGTFLMDAARKHFGIIRLPDFVVADAVAAGDLFPVLPDADFEIFGIFLIHSANRRVNKRMRAFIDAILCSCMAQRAAETNADARAKT